MPGFHHSVAVSPFCRCKIPLFCKNYVRKFRSVTAVDGKKIRKRQRQRCTETATANENGETATEERQRTGGNGGITLFQCSQIKKRSDGQTALKSQITFVVDGDDNTPLTLNRNLCLLFI